MESFPPHIYPWSFKIKKKTTPITGHVKRCYFFVANLKDRKDPPMVSGEWTCRVRRGVLVLKNDASFEGPMNLREVNQLKVPKSTSCSSIIQTSLFGIFISYLLFLRLFQRFWVFMWFVSTFSWLTPYEWGKLLLLPFLASTCQLLWLITLEHFYQTASFSPKTLPFQDSWSAWQPCGSGGYKHCPMQWSGNWKLAHITTELPVSRGKRFD